MNMVSLAQERLLYEGNWPNILKRIQIQCHDGIIVLPDEFDSAYRVAREVEGSLKITDSWFVLAPQNQVPGNYSTLTCEDLGETAVYRHPKGRRIKAYSEDSQDITIYADNETVTITPGNRDTEPAPTAKAYFDVQRVERASSGKPFELVYVSLDDGESFGGRFSGYWESVGLRTYRVGGTTIDDEVVEVVARRRPIPITGDTSPMVITNTMALRLALMSITKEDAGMADEAEVNLRRAIDVLDSENQRFHPHEQQPTITVVGGFGDIPVL